MPLYTPPSAKYPLPSGLKTPPLSVGLPRDFATITSPEAVAGSLQDAVFSVSSLDLMHHYSISTHITLSPNNKHGDIWRAVAPKEAFSHNFLLHGILALSALHKAHLEPETAQQNTELAMQHYASAISLFRPVLTNIQSDNVVAAFCFSALVVFISWAFPIPEPEPQPGTHDSESSLGPNEILQHVVDILRLQRGVRDVISSGRESVRPLAPMFKLKHNAADAALPTEDEAAMKKLEQRIYSDLESEDLRTVYMEALQQFRRFYPLESSDDPHVLVRAWPTQLSREFFTAMAERRPLAVVILAYHGALLHGLRDCWWLGDKGRRLVVAASECLPPGYEDVMEWPRMRAGLDEAMEK